MEKEASPSISSQDVTLAAHGFEQRVDEKTLFCTPDPQAASTVVRELNRLQVPTTFASKGSFLDDMSRLSLQSVSGLDLTHQLNFNLTSEVSPQERGHAVEDSGPDLIQFSGNTEAGSSDQDNKSDSQTDTSSRSSMGLIPSDMLNDCDLLKSLSGTELSASVLPMSTSKMAEPSSEARSKEVDSSHSTLREKTANSKDWSDSSKQDSKQDSKDMPWGRSQLETVKKRPQPTNNGREGGPRGLAARGAVALFAGHLLDDVAEGEELDQSMHSVELGEDDLKQLDADVDFSDLEDDPVLGGESGDEDFDFDGPMLSLPTRGRVERREQENQEEKTLQAELVEAESRVGEGQESEENGAVAQPAVRSVSDHAIDSRYFRKTPMSFAGDGEDREFVSSGSNLFDSSQQRGAAEGEHLLTKLRRQFMAGDGSENEVDTDDELEAVKKSLALATRERGQGADEEDSDRSNLPLPVGLEDVNSSDSQSHGSKRDEEQASEFFLTRQRAEGNAAYSPVPWDGAGEGDGSSEGDSEGSRGKVSRSADRLQFRYVSGASMDPNQPSATDQSLIPPSEQAAESGLQPEFFLPTSSNSLLQDSEVISPQTLEGSTFNVEDILKSATEVLPSVAKDKGRNASRTDASGFSAKDVPDLFEGQFANSFGSFGLGPEEGEVDSGATGRSMEKSSGGAELSGSTGEEAPSPVAEVLAKKAVGGLPSKGSGSFDGPFRKPRAPAPPRKKTFTKEAEPVERSETWKNAVFQGTDVLGESHMDRELRELGIHLDDDEFQTGEGAVAMLDADEKEFEEDNKFSQHHHLALAAEGLAWEREQSCFSGFLGGEESPDNTETSIGTYMAARTEPLGTLGGDPSIPRPEFGKSLSSPPQRTNPMKLMSPPSTYSSMLSCRSEGEGDEEADKTMVCGDSTLHSAESPDHLLSQEAPKPVSTETCEDRAAAEPTLRLGELSSMLLDLTQGGGDITMEDVLSNSAVLDFVKNNSYSNPLDFVSAIMKLSHSKKQQQQVSGGGSDSVSKEQLSPGAEDSRKRNGKQVTGSSGDKARREGLPAHSSSSSGMSKPASASSLSQRGRGSRLPVCAGRASSAGEKGSVKKGDIRVDKNKSRNSVPGGSAPKRRSHSEQRQDGDSAKRDVGKQRVDQIPKGAASGDVPLAVSVSGDRRSKQFSSRESVSGSVQRPGLVKTDALSKKTSRTRVEKDQPHVSSSPKSNDDLKSQTQSKPQRERDLGLNVSNQDQRSDDTWQDLGDNVNMNSMNAVDSARHLNIPVKAGKDTEGTELRGKFMSQQKDSALHTDEGEREEREKWKDSDQPSMLLTPTQRLSASGAAATIAGTSQPEALRPGSLHPVPPTHPSSTGQLTLQPAGDSALAAPGSTGPLDFTAADSRPLDVSSITKGSQPPPPLVSQDAAQRLDASLHSFPATSQLQGQPTLLTGSSLLRTEFAQRYLTPAARGQGGGEPGQHLGHSGGMNVTSSHLPSERRVVPTLSTYTSSQSAQVYGSHPQLQPNSVPGQRGQLPSSTAPTVDELAMSVYYELNEDLEQSTMLGVEGSALGSFWGKSPLYQSTPALELGRMAAISMTGSRLDERELTTPGTNMVSPRVQRQLIQIQRTLDFPEFCCLGVSQKTVLPVTNRTSYGVTCRFRLVRLLHQGNPVKMDQQTPFELKPKISIGAGASENVPVLFVPKRPGEHVCQIEVYAQSMNPSLEPTVSVVQLTAMAEVPHIQFSPSEEVLDLGEVTWGGCQSRTIRMRNTKKASLPVRLSIWSGSSVWHCFTFDSCDNSSDRSIISMTSRPESLGRNVVTVTLPGCDSPDAAEIVEFTLYCRPPKKDHSRAVAERPADQIDAKIDIEVDTPVKYLPPLSSIFLKATVGMPRLLIPTSHMSLTFRTKPNKSMQESIRINNAGNITLSLALSVSSYLECFEISASRVTIKPGASEQVAVVFSPQGGDVSHYQSLLQLDVEPEGPSYEIPLEGQVAGLRAQCRAALNMMASTSFLSFHGVSLNQTRSLTVRLYNKDHTCAEHACVEIRRSSDCFKLVSTSGEWQQECDVVIEPRQTVTLTVIFCPTAVQGYSGKLVIRKPDTHSTKYSIGLAGYGGRSVLALSGACLTNSGQRWLELGPLSLSCNIMREIVLTNTGVRAAFIRASAFYDMPCQQPVAPGRVAMEPNNFVLAPGCSMKVVVAISPSQREVDLVKVRKEVVAVVRFQHGDEVVRQKYLRAFSRDGGGGDTRSGQAAFRQPFANEAQDSVVLEGSSVVDSPDDAKAFFNHLESMCVALLGQPSPSQHTSMSVTSQLHTPSALGDSTSSLPTHDQTYPNLREESRGPNSTVQFLVPGRPDSDVEDWTVKPDFLSLTVGEKNQKTLQLINFSKQPVSFELSWPSNSVVPEPQKGELKPRSRRSVEVWLHMSWQQRLSELPWRGVIIVTCNGQEKSVRVTVQKPAQSPRLPLSAPHTSAGSPGMSSSDTASHSLRLASTNIHFVKARVNAVHESVLELTNASVEPVQLKLSPFAPAYVKRADETNTVKRVSYSAFTFPSITADLLPQETVKLPVKFCPQTKGMFNQHWEIEYWPLESSKKAGQAKMSTRISLTAEVTEQEVSSKKPAWDPVEQDKAGVSTTRTPLQEKHPNTIDAGDDRGSAPAPDLQLLQSDVTFSKSKVGQVTQVKIEFKNSLDHDVHLEVNPPSAPFFIKHKTFKITKKRILKYPITFSPSGAGSFADSMVFRAPDLGKTFRAHLKGTAV